MTHEVELKLALAPGDLQRLPRLGLIRGLQRGEARDRRLVSTYYDTPDRTLRGNGMALRVRHDGDGYVQTLKAPVAENDRHRGLQHMRESEVRLPGPEPRPDHVDDPDLRALVTADGMAEAIGPVFTTELKRREIMLEFGISRIELAIDSGEVVAEAGRLPISEAELELKAGDPADLYQLARMLAGYVDMRLQGRSKAARGYAILSGAPPAPEKAPKPDLDPGMTVAQAFERHAAACLQQIRANIEVVFANDDPEGIHKLRVGLRRLRAVLDAFRPALNAASYRWLRGELRWFQQQLGPAREWDVFVEETLTPIRTHLPGDERLDRLADAVAACRADANSAARDAIASARASHVLLSLEAWLASGAWRVGGPADPGERDATAYARDVLADRWKKVRKLGKKHGKLSWDKLHRLRIRGKKLRYTGEAFASLFPGDATKAYLKHVEALQETLGSLNDAATAERLLTEAHARMTGEQRVDRATADAAVATVRGWLAAQTQRDLAGLGERWKRLADTSPFWRGKPAA